MKVPGISPDKQELQGLETSVKMGLDLEYEKDGMVYDFFQNFLFPLFKMLM